MVWLLYVEKRRWIVYQLSCIIIMSRSPYLFTVELLLLKMSGVKGSLPNCEVSQEWETIGVYQSEPAMESRRCVLL